MKVKGKRQKILVSMRIAYGSGRDIICGISRYARQHCHWQLRVINFAGKNTIEDIRRADDEGVDGIITIGLDEPAMKDFVVSSHTPFVGIGGSGAYRGICKDNIAIINNNDTSIGCTGAQYLASLGHFRSYGFIARSEDDVPPDHIHTFREQGFRSYLANKTRDVRTYKTAACLERGSASDIAALVKWLKSMPKPAAVMAAHDLRATHAIEAARVAGIKIPQDIVVIGVDNDEIYCETSDPTITSIDPDHVRLGELAAKVLKSLIAKSASGDNTMTFNLPSRIVERESTRAIPPATLLVERAISFIRQNATKGIGAVDVTEHLGVSRRLADLRFRQITGGSLLEAILSRRFEEVRRLLVETDLPITKIVANCGFRTESNAKNLFRKRFGVTMSDYRRQNRR